MIGSERNGIFFRGAALPRTGASRLVGTGLPIGPIGAALALAGLALHRRGWQRGSSQA